MSQPRHHGFMTACGLRLVLGASALVTLAGCSGSQEELDGWMASERARTLPMVQPITPPSKFNPERYAGIESVDPFSVQNGVLTITAAPPMPSSGSRTRRATWSPTPAGRRPFPSG